MLDLYAAGVVTVDEVRAALNLSGDADTIAELKNIQLVKNQKQQNELKVDEDQNIVDESSEKQKEDVIDDKTKGKEE